MIGIQLAVFHDFRLFFPNTPRPLPLPKKRSWKFGYKYIWSFIRVICTSKNIIEYLFVSKQHSQAALIQKSWLFCSSTASFDNIWTLQNLVLGIPLDSLQSVLYLYLQCRKYVVKENIHDLKYSISFAKKVKSLHINELKTLIFKVTTLYKIISLCCWSGC